MLFMALLANYPNYSFLMSSDSISAHFTVYFRRHHLLRIKLKYACEQTQQVELGSCVARDKVHTSN